MQAKSPARHDVIIAGIGGTGSMIIGQILAAAGVSKYRYVLWNPSMTTARRGAPADCTIILSDEEIASPLLLRVQTVLMTESSRLKAFENRVLPGGLIVLETSGLKDKVERNDVRVMEVPGVETAARVGSALARNMVLLGAYVEAVKPVPVEPVEAEINKRFGRDQELLSLNSGAFREGVKLTAKSSPKV